MSFLLQQILLQPQRTFDLDNDQLSILLSQGRGSRLMGSLAFEIQGASVDTHGAHGVLAWACQCVPRVPPSTKDIQSLEATAGRGGSRFDNHW